MSDLIIIQHLTSGLHPEFKKELSRRESSMHTLDEFLKYAKIEQDLYDTFEKSRSLSLQESQPYYEINHLTIPSLTAAVKPQQQHYHERDQNNYDTHPKQLQSSGLQRNSIHTRTNQPSTVHNQQRRNFPRQSTFNKTPNNNQSTLQHQFYNCKVCDRNNHRTIDCFHKRTTGCFNCGQNHNVRDCTLPPNFQ